MWQHFAYLDAGTGSLFIQSVIGAGLAISVVYRRVLSATAQKLKTSLSRQK